MAKQANRMMIGVFVVVGVAIMAASLVIFGSGDFFKKTVKCVMYFDGSVKGLSVGAPVLFQGVQIGSVKSIILEVDPTELQLQIPVIIEYEPEKFKVGGEGQHLPRDPRKTIPKLIEKGPAGRTGHAEFYYRAARGRDWFLSRLSRLLCSGQESIKSIRTISSFPPASPLPNG